MSPAIAIVLAALGAAAPARTVGVDATAPVVAPAPAPAATPATTASPTPPEDAEPDPAARAGELFRRGEFEQAAAAFEVAYERTGDPALLFGRAQALRRAGNCGAAIDVFEAFIAAGPPPDDVQAARDVIAACRSVLAEGGAAPEPDATVPDPVVEDAPPPPPPRWPRDVAGGVLLGSGLAVAIAGAAVYGTAFARSSDRMETEQAYETRQRSVRTLAATGAGLMIGGTALLVGSVVRYAIVARRQRARRSGPAVSRR
jgi:hypothetical protein